LIYIWIQCWNYLNHVEMTKLIMNSIVLFVFILPSVLCLGQDVEYNLSQHFSKLPDSVNCIMIGEEHGRENIANQLEILRTVYEAKGGNYVFIEFPRTNQVELDLFFASKILSPEGIERYSRNKYMMEMVQGLKKDFANEITSGKIKVICFDVEADNEIVARFSDVIRYFDDKRLNGLKSLCSVKPTTLEQNLEIGKNILNELQGDLNLYKSVFGDYFPSIFVGLKESIKIQSIPDFQFSYDVDEYREHALDSTVRATVDFRKDKIIILTGMDHVAITSSDEFSDTDSRKLTSLYERLEMNEEIHLIRYNFLYMPNRFPRGILFYRIEKYLDRKKWMKLLKKKKYLICSVDQITEEDCTEYGDYFIMNNIKM